MSNSDFIAYILVFASLVVCMVMLRFFAINKPTKIRGKSNLKVVVLMGSGGHSTEMERLLVNLHRKYNQRIYIITKGDNLSLRRIYDMEESRKSRGRDYHVVTIRRARQVGQSYITSIWTSLLCLYDCFKVVYATRPHIVRSLFFFPTLF